MFGLMLTSFSLDMRVNVLYIERYHEKLSSAQLDDQHPLVLVVAHVLFPRWSSDRLVLT